MNHEANHDVANIENKIAPTRMKPGHNLLIFETYNLIYSYLFFYSGVGSGSGQGSSRGSRVGLGVRSRVGSGRG